MKTRTTKEQKINNIIYLMDDIEKNPSVHTLIRVAKGLKKFPVDILAGTLYAITGKKPVTEDKDKIIIALKYLMQQKHYDTIYKKPMPSNVKELTERLIQECM